MAMTRHCVSVSASSDSARDDHHMCIRCVHQMCSVCVLASSMRRHVLPCTKTSHRGHLLSTKLPRRSAAEFQSTLRSCEAHPARNGCVCRSTPITFHCEHRTLARRVQDRSTSYSEMASEYQRPEPLAPGLAATDRRSHARTMSCPRRAAALAMVRKMWTYGRLTSSGACLTFLPSARMTFRKTRSWSNGSRIALNSLRCRKAR